MLLLRNLSKFLALILTLCAQVSAAVIAELDASTLPEGALSEAGNPIPNSTWHPNVSLQVQTVGGRKALVFTGNEQLISEPLAGAGLTKAFTVEAWVQNPEFDRLETVVSVAPARGGGGAEFGFGTSPGSGAFRFGFKATAPFVSLPSAADWHYLAWTYDGSTLRVYVDGELDSERPLKVVLTPPQKVHVGASGEVDNKGPKKALSGAIARVRVQDVALSQVELRQGAGLVSAYAPEPRSGSVTDTLQVKLRWRMGDGNHGPLTIFAGADRAAVERGDAAMANPASANEFGPIALAPGEKYYWRVEEGKGKSPKVSSPVWTFVADPGFATEPAPRDGTSNTPDSLPKLSWQPGKYATKQMLYVGTNQEEVQSRETKMAEALSGMAARSPLPKALQPGTRYYWCVDSENGSQPASHGPVWSFRTQDAPVHNDVTFFVASDTHYGRENNAFLSRKIIDAMNALPGTPMPASIGGGAVRTPRGVVLNGDLLDEGFDPERAPSLWKEFCRDYGLSGEDGRLCYPLYEGFGNHDGGPVKSITRAGIRERNPRRIGLTAISPDGHHYSWDWEQVHLVQLNLFGGAGPQDVKGVNAVEHDPEGALQFLRDDLAKHVGDSGKVVIVFQHFAWAGGMADWWQAEAKERFFEVIKPYRIACLINGHSHGAAFVPWHDLLTVHDGSTARGEGDTGDFMVVRVTDQELILAQRKLDGTWGIQKRVPLGATPKVDR